MLTILSNEVVYTLRSKKQHQSALITIRITHRIIICVYVCTIIVKVFRLNHGCCLRLAYRNENN